MTLRSIVCSFAERCNEHQIQINTSCSSPDKTINTTIPSTRCKLTGGYCYKGRCVPATYVFQVRQYLPVVNRTQCINCFRSEMVLYRGQPECACSIPAPNSCIFRSCDNGGTCIINVTALAFECICVFPFTGIFCETALNYCVHGNLLQDASCNCSMNYYGKHCQHYSACLSNPCLNGGTCHDTDNNGFTCVCSNNHTGNVCESHLVNCVFGVLDLTTNRCKCDHNYKGFHCDTVICTICDRTPGCELFYAPQCDLNGPGTPDGPGVIGVSGGA